MKVIVRQPNGSKEIYTITGLDDVDAAIAFVKKEMPTAKTFFIRVK